MQRGGIFFDLQGDSKEDALQAAVERIPNLERIDRKIVLEKLLEREQMASTGIGHGVALPPPQGQSWGWLDAPADHHLFLPPNRFRTMP